MRKGSGGLGAHVAALLAFLTSPPEPEPTITLMTGETIRAGHAIIVKDAADRVVDLKPKHNVRPRLVPPGTFAAQDAQR